MEKVIWSKRSVESLKKIWNFYVYKLNTVSGANSIVDGIRKTGDNLSVNILHQTEEYLKPNQYRTVYKHFKIVYIVKNNQVQILQIFDSRQNPKKILR